MDTTKLMTLSDGRKLAYTVYGDPKGKPVFFFHGWPSCHLHAKIYDDVAKKLKIRLIALDRPGYGKSDFKPHRALLDYPDDVVALANHLKLGRFSVIGISGGGPYAAVTAYKIPERLERVNIVVGLAPLSVRGITKGMSLLNAFGWQNYHRILFLRDISVWLFRMQIRYLPTLRAFSFKAKSGKEIMSKTYMQHYAKRAQYALQQGIKGASWDLKLYTDDWGFRLEDIKKEIDLWYGETDKNVSQAMGDYYAKQLPQNHYTLFKSEGHLCQLTHAEEIFKRLL